MRISVLLIACFIIVGCSSRGVVAQSEGTNIQSTSAEGYRIESKGVSQEEIDARFEEKTEPLHQTVTGKARSFKRSVVAADRLANPKCPGGKAYVIGRKSEKRFFTYMHTISFTCNAELANQYYSQYGVPKAIPPQIKNAPRNRKIDPKDEETFVVLPSDANRNHPEEGIPVYSSKDCVGAIVMGVCHGATTMPPKKRCHGAMLNGRCTGPMF